MDTIPTSDTSKKAGFQTWRVVPSNSSSPWWPFQSTKPHAFAWRGENLDLSHLGWMIFSRWFIWPNGIIFHQLRLLWNKGISLTKPPFGVSPTFAKRSKPILSMYGIFTYIWLIFMVNVGKYTGCYGKGFWPQHMTEACFFCPEHRLN